MNFSTMVPAEVHKVQVIRSRQGGGLSRQRAGKLLKQMHWEDFGVNAYLSTAAAPVGGFLRVNRLTVIRTAALTKSPGYSGSNPFG